MRYAAIPLSLAIACTANAATLEVSIADTNGSHERFMYSLDGKRQTLDLRDSNEYMAAFIDPATRKEICTTGEYRTGLMLTLKSLPPVLREVVPVVDPNAPQDLSSDDMPAPTFEPDPAAAPFNLEVIGQVSNLAALESKGSFGCGVNQKPILENRSFSETVPMFPNRTKAVVVDGTTTLMLTVRE